MAILGPDIAQAGWVAPLRLTQANVPITLSCWMRVTPAVNIGSTPVSLGNIGATTTDPFGLVFSGSFGGGAVSGSASVAVVYYQPAGQVLIDWFDDTGFENQIGTAFTPDSKWHHVAVQINSLNVGTGASEQTVWIDGVPHVGFNTSNTNTTTLNQIQVGFAAAYTGDPAFEHADSVAEVSVWSGTMATLDIQALARGRNPLELSTTNDLVAYYPLRGDLAGYAPGNYVGLAQSGSPGNPVWTDHPNVDLIVPPRRNRVAATTLTFASSTGAVGLLVGQGPPKIASISATGAVAQSGGATVTLDPSKTGADIVLSGGNLIATKTVVGANNWENALSTISVASGKYYFECAQTVLPSGGFAGFGLCNASLGLNTFGGGTTNGIDWNNNGQVYYNNSVIATINGCNANDVIGIAFDVTNGLMWVKNFTQVSFWNNSGTANPATGVGGIPIGVTGPLYVAAMLYTGYAGSVNFGSSGFAGSVPAGFAMLPGTAPVGPSVAPALLNGVAATGAVGGVGPVDPFSDPFSADFGPVSNQFLPTQIGSQLSSIQTTSAIGSFTTSIVGSPTIAGVASVGAVGVLGIEVDDSSALIGITATGAVGSVGTQVPSSSLTGVSSTDAVGLLGDQAQPKVLSSVQSTGAVGSLRVGTTLAALTGVSATCTVGASVFSGDFSSAFGPLFLSVQLGIALSSVSSSTAAGILTGQVSGNPTLTGVSATGVPGTLIASNQPSLAGVKTTGVAGAVVASTNLSSPISGVSLTGAAGSLEEQAQPLPLAGATTVATVAPLGLEADTNVSIVGVSTTASVAPVGFSAGPIALGFVVANGAVDGFGIQTQFPALPAATTIGVAGILGDDAQFPALSAATSTAAVGLLSIAGQSTTVLTSVQSITAVGILGDAASPTLTEVLSTSAVGVFGWQAMPAALLGVAATDAVGVLGGGAALPALVAVSTATAAGILGDRAQPTALAEVAATTAIAVLGDTAQIPALAEVSATGVPGLLSEAVKPGLAGVMSVTAVDALVPNVITSALAEVSATSAVESIITSGTPSLVSVASATAVESLVAKVSVPILGVSAIGTVGHVMAVAMLGGVTGTGAVGILARGTSAGPLTSVFAEAAVGSLMVTATIGGATAEGQAGILRVLSVHDHPIVRPVFFEGYVLPWLSGPGPGL